MNPFFYVIDDVFDKSIQNYIENLIISSDFPWFYRPNMDNNKKKNNYPWLSHPLIVDGKNVSIYTSKILSVFINKRIEILNKTNLNFDISNPYRMNLNFTYEKSKLRMFHSGPWHVDNYFNHIVMLYYVNDSAGKTELKNITKVSPKKGRLLIFDGSIEHRIHLPSNKNRFVINFNYIV